MNACNVILDLTEDCMLRCKYCYINGGDSSLKMNVKTAINAVQKFSNSYKNGKVHLLFHGGEPLLAFDIIQEVIQFIEVKKINNIKLYIQTNGVQVDNFTAKYLKEKDVHVCLSIDGFTASSNATRISAINDSSYTLERILNGLDCLINAGNNVSTICVLNRLNFLTVSDYLEECVKRGIFLVSMNPIINLGRSTLNTDLLLENDEIADAYITIIQKINSLLGDGYKIMERNSYYYYRRYLNEKPEYICMNTPCGAGSCVFVIKCNGDIYPCSDFSFEPDLKLGNVNDNILFSLPEKKRLKLLKDLYTANLDNNSECLTCKWRRKCPSGCSARKYLASGYLKGSIDPLCSMYKKLNSFFETSGFELECFLHEVISPKIKV